MARFRRDKADLRRRLAGFWSFWEEIRPRVETALLRGDLGPARDELTRQVHAVHPELEWEIGAGRQAQHALTVTGGGAPHLRGITERWRRSGPAPDVSWEFHAARQPRPEALEGVLDLDGHELEPSHTSLELRVDGRRARVDVTAYHPDFLFLDEKARRAVARRVLDAVLGEDDVARWVGEVRPAVERPLDPLPPTALPDVLAQLAAAYPTPTWLTGEGLTPRGRPARLTVRFPLRRVDFPLCEHHVVVGVPYAHANPDRLPVEPSAGALGKFETALSALGERAVLAAHETGDDHRVFHLYADVESGVLAEIDQLAAGWAEGRVRVAARTDPGWRAIAPYLT